jgi:hypocretin (orexin) receptor 2
VCVVVWRSQHMHTVTNCFIVNLSVADLMVILICLPPSVVEDVAETWFAGGVMCKLVKYVQVGQSQGQRCHSTSRINVLCKLGLYI